MITFVIGATLIIGATWFISTFWEEIKEFLIKTFDIFKERFKKAKKAALGTYLKKKNFSSAIQAGWVFIQKFVEKSSDGQWRETITTNTLSVNELPKDIQAKLNNAKLGQEVDITNETKETLKLETK